MRHLQIYQAIRTIVENGSIRKASDFLAISPSALNRQILAFEQDLGTSLFDRIPGGLRLSTAGEIYYRSIIEHLAAFDRARETVNDLSGLRIGTVRIAVSPELAGHFLPRVVMAFHLSAPGVRVQTEEVAPDAFVQALNNDTADLAVILQPAFDGHAEILASGETATVLLAERPDQIGIERFQDQAFALPPEGSGLRTLFDLWFRRKLIERAPTVETARMLPAWPGFQAWAALDLPAELPAGLAVAERPDDLPRANVVLAQRAGRPLPLAAARFATLVSERLS